MRSPAAAIAWQFQRHHRWGFLAVAGYLLGLAAFRLIAFGPGQPAGFEDDQSFAFVVLVPLSAAFLYLLAVFSFGLAGDLAGRASIYPARMFTLPVTSAALAGWPMLYGTSAVAILWLLTRLVAVWPAGVEVPLLWPALLAAAILAWTQALSWTPYALPGLRVIVTVLLMFTIDAVVFTALECKASEPVMLALLAPHVPLAYLAARFAVARARHGDVPDWRVLFARPARIAGILPRRRDRFPSPARAQAWFEWRLWGRSLPALVAILLPFELSLLFLFRDTPAVIFETLVCALLTPPFLAVFVAATVSRSDPDGSDSHGLTPFVAARPLASTSLVAAKLKVALWSTLVAWLLVALAVPFGVRLSGTVPTVIDWARRLSEGVGTPRAVAIGLLVCAALMASTWKQLVQSLCIGLTGRAGLVKGSVFTALAFLTVFVPVTEWTIRRGHVVVLLWSVLPWILVALVCFKLSAAAWIAVRLHEARLFGERTLVLGAVSWDVLVFSLYGILLWLVPALLVRGDLVLLVAILEIPLVRFSAAPLALAWNRHR